MRDIEGYCGISTLRVCDYEILGVFLIQVICVPLSALNLPSVLVPRMTEMFLSDVLEITGITGGGAGPLLAEVVVPVAP